MAVAALAFGVRAAYLCAVGPAPRFAMTPDSVAYLQAAKNLQERGAFSTSEAEPLVPDTVRTPGYPALIAVCGGNLRTLLWLQALLGAATVGLLFLTATLLWHDRGAAYVAGIALACDPITVMHSGLVLTETLFIFTFSLGFLCAAKAWSMKQQRGANVWWISAGAAFGLMALVRPIGLYFPLCSAAALALFLKDSSLKNKARSLALFLAASAIVPAIWMTRNKIETGVFTFCSIQGLNFAVRAAAVEQELTGADFATAFAKVNAAIKAEHPEPFTSKAAEGAFTGRWSACFLASHPVAYGHVMVKDVVKLFGGHGMEIAAWGLLKDAHYDPMHPEAESGNFSGTRGLISRHRSLALAIPLYILALAGIYLLAALGALAAWKARETGALALALSPIVYFAALTVGMMVYYRLRLPLFPAVLLLAGRGAASLGRAQAS